MKKERKSGRFSWLLEEWVAQLGLTALILVAVVDGVLSMSGGGLF